MYKTLNSPKNMPNLVRRALNQRVVLTGSTQPDPRCFHMVYKEKASLR